MFIAARDEAKLERTRNCACDCPRERACVHTHKQITDVGTDVGADLRKETYIETYEQKRDIHRNIRTETHIETYRQRHIWRHTNRDIHGDAGTHIQQAGTHRDTHLRTWLKRKEILFHDVIWDAVEHLREPFFVSNALRSSAVLEDARIPVCWSESCRTQAADQTAVLFVSTLACLFAAESF